MRARIQAADTFKAICDEYCEKRRRDGTKGWAPATATSIRCLWSAVHRQTAIGEIEPADVLTAPTVTHYRVITDAKKAGELRHVEWSEIDLDGALWIIPAGKMKSRRTHHVPLSRQAVELFREVQSVTGPTGYVFPSVRTRTRPMRKNTVNAGLRRLGYATDEMTAHGFRAMASTLLNESGKWNPDAIERALAHGDTDKVRTAYHRGAQWKERVDMAQWWSDYLDQLRKGADAVMFRPKGVA